MGELKEYTVGGYLPTSFLDWEGHIAPVIFVSGCNFRCPWCHNREIVLAETEKIPAAGILRDIAHRAKFLDGVVITGGEPTLWQGLTPLLAALKEMGLPVKLDTNGSNPRLLKKILEEKLAAHVAMDIKAPFDDAVLRRVTGAEIAALTLKESVEIIKKLAPSYEFRTTWSPRILSEAELLRIRRELSDDGHWVVQPFVPTGCLDPEYCELPKTAAADIERLLPGIRIRG